MKKILLVIFFCADVLSAVAFDKISLRNKFYASVNNSREASDFISYLATLNEKNSPIIMGYRGMGYLLLAKHAFNPYSKLAWFIKGKNLLDSSILSDKNDPELRFLRLSVQTNAPFFLNYSGKTEQDKKLILQVYSILTDVDLKIRIGHFFREMKIPITQMDYASSINNNFCFYLIPGIRKYNGTGYFS